MDEATWTCGYCLWPVEAGQAWEQCDSCERVVHKECWEENGGCMTLGCFEHVRVEPPDYTKRAIVPMGSSASDVGIASDQQPAPITSRIEVDS